VHDCGSPSQQPSLKRHLEHCQVWCRHSIAAPQRRQRSPVSRFGSRSATLAAAPDANAQ